MEDLVRALYVYRRRLNFRIVAPGTAKIFNPMVSLGPGGDGAYISNGGLEPGSAVSGS